MEGKEQKIDKIKDIIGLLLVEYEQSQAGKSLEEISELMDKLKDKYSPLLCDC